MFRGGWSKRRSNRKLRSVEFGKEKETEGSYFEKEKWTGGQKSFRALIKLAFAASIPHPCTVK